MKGRLSHTSNHVFGYNVEPYLSPLTLSPDPLILSPHSQDHSAAYRPIDVSQEAVDGTVAALEGDRRCALISCVCCNEEGTLSESVVATAPTGWPRPSPDRGGRHWSPSSTKEASRWASGSILVSATPRSYLVTQITPLQSHLPSSLVTPTSRSHSVTPLSSSQVLLELVQCSPQERWFHEMALSSLHTLHLATLAPFTRRRVAGVTLSNQVTLRLDPRA